LLAEPESLLVSKENALIDGEIAHATAWVRTSPSGPRPGATSPR
jgi:hypothetical protein